MVSVKSYLTIFDCVEGRGVRKLVFCVGLASRQIHIIPTLRISHPFFEACDPLVKAGEHVTVSLGSG
jgi:hypothetical protein